MPNEANESNQKPYHVRGDHVSHTKLDAVVLKVAVLGYLCSAAIPVRVLDLTKLKVASRQGPTRFSIRIISGMTKNGTFIILLAVGMNRKIVVQTLIYYLIHIRIISFFKGKI